MVLTSHDALGDTGEKTGFWVEEFAAPYYVLADAGQIGFIAQEIEKVFPELVVTGKNGYKGVDYSKITPVLLEAIKDQQKQIDELNRKLEKLISVIKN